MRQAPLPDPTAAPATEPRPPHLPARDPAVVVGAGLAGLTCALDLAEAGIETTLVERRPFVGGKTFSFLDKQSGAELDNGQHVYLRCCTAYTALLDRLGLQDRVTLQSRLRLPVLDPDSGRRGAIAAAPGPLPPPLHLAWSLLRFPHLRWADKLQLTRAVLPLMRMSETTRRGLDGESFGDWLRARGQSQAVIERFWDLIVLPTCNDLSDAVSAAQAAYVFKTGLFDDAHGADIGVARVGLSHIAEAALRRFRTAGGTARLGRRATAIESGPGRALTVRVGDTLIEAAAVILALPPNRAQAMLPEAWRARDGLAHLHQFHYSPIVNLHLHLDRPLLREPFLAVLHPDIQYVFNRDRISGRRDPEGGQWLDVSLSGAHDQAARPQAAIAETTIAALRRAFPAARDATVTHWRVVTEREATFRPLPGSARLRPGPRTGVDGLFLAGAWTDTQWPATMESAVRSGHAAAAAVIEARAAARP